MTQSHLCYISGLVLISQNLSMDGGSNEVDHWREIAAQKEKEWKQVTEQRFLF